MLIEHPIAVINELLKLGIGDKGRLDYLKNAIKNGKKIYDSDKEFLKNMQNELEQIKFGKSTSYEKESGNYQKDYHNISNLEGRYINSQNENNHRVDKINSESDSGVDKIQFLITELKKNNSRLMDNLNLLTTTDSDLMYKLELLRINREIVSQYKIKNSESSNKIFNLPKNNNARLIEPVKNTPELFNSKLHKIKKHQVMIYASAGFLSLWYADFQNLIDLGAFRNIAVGLAAGAAVAAALFYKKQKKENTLSKESS